MLGGRLPRRRLPGRSADNSVIDRDAFLAEKLCLTLGESGRETAVSGNDPPPRQSVTRGEDVSDGTRRTRRPGLGGDLAVRHHVPG